MDVPDTCRAELIEALDDPHAFITVSLNVVFTLAVTMIQGSAPAPA
jgi:hypothetical protein